MVKTIHRSSYYSNNGSTKVRLSFFSLRSLVLAVGLIHLIILWRASIGGQNNNVSLSALPSHYHGDVSQTTNNEHVPTIIPFVVSMTNCGDDPFMEGAAVLKYSIHLASIHGNLGGRYDYKMYAIHHPDAAECAASLQELGYELIERQTPVKVEEIEGEYLRSRIELNGCCGSKELIKLEAYTLVQYPIVVHLDLDVILVKPMDVLFDVMLDDTGDLSKYQHSLDLMWPDRALPSKVNAFFTRDFNMVKFGRKIFPVQGGFLVLRPDMNVYNELVNIVKKGDFDQYKGWGKATGLFYGSMTIQGLLPYYYDVLHKNETVDLNRCIYNQMCDKPRGENKKFPTKPGRCNTGEKDCEDCRERPIEDLVSGHFTICLKPWHCVAHHKDDIEHWLCRKMHHEWFRLRSGLEKTWGRNATGSGTWFQEQFFGFCWRHGKKGYIPISRPFLPTFT